MLDATARALELPDTLAFAFFFNMLKGAAVGSAGVRARHERQLTIRSAIEGNVLSRVCLGVHWQFDGREGERYSQQVATK